MSDSFAEPAFSLILATALLLPSSPLSGMEGTPEFLLRWSPKKWAVAWGLDETERTSDRVLGNASADFPPLRDHVCAFFIEEFRSVSELP